MFISREEYLVISSILAALFWITLAATIFLLSLFIAATRKKRCRMMSRSPGGQELPTGVKTGKGEKKDKDINTKRRI